MRAKGPSLNLMHNLRLSASNEVKGLPLLEPAHDEIYTFPSQGQFII